jgi:hypothetical protein
MSESDEEWQRRPGQPPFPCRWRGLGHIGEDREELQDGGGLDDPLKDATSAGDARTGRPLADPPRAADRRITPESDVDDLGSLEYEVRQPLQPCCVAAARAPHRSLTLTQADMARHETKTSPHDSWRSEVSFASQLHESPRHVSPPPVGCVALEPRTDLEFDVSGCERM